MASANELILNESIAHAIDLIRYSNGSVRRIIALLNRVDKDLFAQLIIKLDEAPESPSVERIDALLVSIRELNAKAYAQVSEQLDIELKEVSSYELGYQKQLFESIIPIQVNFTTVNYNQAYAAAMSRPFQGKLLKEWLAGLEEGKAIAIRDAIRIGYIEGETNSQIVKRIRGTRALNYADGLLETNRMGAEAIVRTAISHTTNFSRELLFEANSDLIKGWRFTATLDARTTVFCASHDGKIYAIGSGPAIPHHIRCRSIKVQVLKSWQELGLNVDEFKSTRASLDGQVPSDVTYQQWLKNQSAERQNEVLGVTKAKLFRDGNLPLDRFVNNAGHEYSLDELRVRDAAAFELAGI